MKTYRAMIQDLNRYGIPPVTEMVITEMTHFGGDMMRFRHADNTVTIIKIQPGWNITVVPLTETD